eukprot:TRINITY_DN1873_c0_g1_i1.p1 TRINITY_DN1873_c0_g1~~TRINITY_DN1873_c0_g1_i1.p1  ORF type:complete len:162 (+),score=56.65 TRINITY_DN1873_c0_g1_i1:253-738(+)
MSESKSVNVSEMEVIEREDEWMVFKFTNGPFDVNAKKAWGAFWQIWGPLGLPTKSISASSMMDESKEGDDKYSYRAGAFLESELEEVPEGLEQQKLGGGKFARFVYTGPYDGLGDAYQAVFAAVGSSDVVQRNADGIETYLNSPESTPAEELETEILIAIE